MIVHSTPTRGEALCLTCLLYREFPRFSITSIAQRFPLLAPQCLLDDFHHLAAKISILSVICKKLESIFVKLIEHKDTKAQRFLRKKHRKHLFCKNIRVWHGCADRCSTASCKQVCVCCRTSTGSPKGPAFTEKRKPLKTFAI